jgi:hypothetical protein
MDVKYVFERSEDFIRAIREEKIKKVFVTQEVIPTGERTILAVLRLTAVSDSLTAHYTLNEVAYNGVRTEDNAEVITEAIALKRNKVNETFSASAPTVLLLSGAVFP